MDIEDDPYVQSLRAQLDNQAYGSPEWFRLDQKLSKTIKKQNSFTHKGLRDLEGAAAEICVDVGPWAADWYIGEVLAKAKTSANPLGPVIVAWQNREKTYLLNALEKIEVRPVSYEINDIVDGTSAKTRLLIERLLVEKETTEADDESYSGLLFVTRRDTGAQILTCACHKR
jgi:endoribonuclease Dicer